uniref:WH1 domain-containing protein n=1 Tax=Dendroctonus ponderosae TaxID=77166 RepID=J3JUM8_DENPD|nr:unknown [Dendroctonus ponderosae]
MRVRNLVVCLLLLFGFFKVSGEFVMKPNDRFIYTPTCLPIERRMSHLSISSSRNTENTAPSSDIAMERLSHKYDSYQDFLHRNQLRRRLSSTGENSGDSSTTASGSSYGEHDGSEGRADSEASSDTQDPKLLDGHISELERQKVEAFFRGLKTQVFVSNSLANLYTKGPSDQDWQLKYTGIPVVILDCGESRARDKRRIQIALAERGTCFMLWSDTIDNLSSYQVDGGSFHTMRYSSDHTIQAGFSFDTKPAAEEMWNHIEKLVACPENISLSTPGKKKRKEKKEKKPLPLPSKSHISQPCCFQHITSVDKEDTERYYSLKELLPRSGSLNPRILDGS